jgi:hypothetical protein
MKLLKLILSVAMVFSIVAPNFSKTASAEEAKTLKTVETFEVKELSKEVNEKGQYEEIGFKKVNSITEVSEGKNFIKTKITAVEDFYNQNGEFKNSVFKIEEFSNNYTTGKAKHKVKVKEYDTPQTLENITKKGIVQKASSKTLDGAKKANVNSKVDKLIKDNKKFKTTEKEVKGITLKKMNELKKISKELQEKEVISVKDGSIKIDKKALGEVVKNNSDSVDKSFSIASVERAGAFDNYYNHDISSGAFTAQALSQSAHKYVKITGSTYNNSKNANTMVSFKSNIDSYERYVIDRMEYATWTEVAGWFGALMGLVSMVVGYGTGPAGWVGIALYYGGALSTFAGLTSSVYATYSRLSLSRYAAQYCQNARNLLYYTNWSNVNMTVVNGF